MWIGKFKIKHECFILSKMEGSDIQVLAYVLGVHEDEDSLYYTTFLIPIGEKKRVEKFIEDMHNDPQVEKVEQHDEQLITLTKVAKNKKHVSSNFSHNLFLVEPILHKDGFEYWHIASWDRKSLVDFYHNTEKVGSVEMLKLQEEPLHDVFFPRVMPQLSEKQKKAFFVALESGYYQYPQGAHLEQLARSMNISRVSYREHLRKAENKLLPFFAQTPQQMLGEK